MTVTKRFLLLLGVVPYCAARAVGRTMKTNKLAWALGFAAIALYAFVVNVNDYTVFELDGDAVTNQGLGGHDWDQVYADSVAGNLNTSKALAIAFDPDLTNTTADNIFQGGGSKDTQGLQQGPWLYTASKPQGKDDLAHSYAAAYTLSNGDLAIYVGADRYDNSGDSTIAFWFFQDSTVGLTTTKSGGGLKFSGVHKDGDLLLISDFTVGGSTSTIHAYKWSGNDATGSLVDAGVLSSDKGFAIVNGVNKPSPWPFTDKGNTGGGKTFAPGEFFEGGVDLNAIYGSALPCFTTFMAETRSSQSPTATLSDFTPPRSFPLCGISITKSCPADGVISADGKSITYNWKGTVHNDGIASLFNPVVTDTLPDNTVAKPHVINPPVYTDAACTAPLGTSALTKNGTTGATGYYCVTFVANGTNYPGGLPLSATNTASVTAAESTDPGAATVTSKTAQSACSTTPVDSMSITKVCGQPYQEVTAGSLPDPKLWTVPGTTLTATNGVVEVKVNFSAKVCNTGTVGASGSISNIVIKDSPTPDLPGISALNDQADCKGNTVTSLAPNACAYVCGTYTPSAIDGTSDGLTNGRYSFTDTIYVDSASATVGTLNPITTCTPSTALACGSTSCAICFGGTCQ